MRVLSLILLLASGASVMAQTGWRIGLPDQETLPLSPAPIVRLSKVDRDSITVRLLNTTGAPLYYRGYSESAPIYFVDELRRDGWRDIQHGWCGTGMEVRTLPAKAIRTIGLPRPRSRHFRIYTKLSQAPGGTKSLFLLYAE